jgi:3-oxoacyl-[acyl-carrier-protein] synthase II
LNPKDRKHVARTVPLALAAAREALADANIQTEELSLEEKRSFGFNWEPAAAAWLLLRNSIPIGISAPQTQASVYVIPSSTQRGASSELSMAFGLRGLSHVVSTGCTSSTDAIFYATDHIASGRQDRMIAGGVDAPIAPGILAGFNVLTVLTSKWNNEPDRASRPFSIDRSGMVLGEGSWMYILESLDSALERGVHIYAEIAGYASTCDAYHRVRLEDTGIEPARAMSMALDDAEVGPEDIDYVNLHGTSTVLNDRIETNALKIAFGDRAYEIPMSSTKSQIGHPQGASGSAGIGSALFAMQTGTVAPTINLDEPDPACDLDYVPNVSRQAKVDVALCNCIGFGSKNSALLLKKV